MLWARLEREYVKKMLERRKEQKRSTGKISHQEADLPATDRKLLIDMKNQAKLWERIDTKVEFRIKSLKATGVIVVGEKSLFFLFPIIYLFYMCVSYSEWWGGGG